MQLCVCRAAPHGYRDPVGKVPIIVRSTEKNLTSKVNFPYFSEMFDQGEPVILMDEDRLLKDVDSPSIRQYFFGRDANPGRAGWYFQQFLKMAM